jgi:zinc/manganese transport system substrate-binding protein
LLALALPSSCAIAAPALAYPRLFEAGAPTAKALATATTLTLNGVDYEPWMQKLLSANRTPGRREILVATLTRKKAGDKPHLWYNFSTIRTLADILTVDLAIPDSNELDAPDKAVAGGAS